MTTRPSQRTRARQAKHREEDQIQRAVMQHIAARGYPQVEVWAVPNGGKRSPVEAAIMSGLGVQAGVGDLSILLPDGSFHELELKAQNGRLSYSQIERGERLNEIRPDIWAVAYGLDDALSILERWGVLRPDASRRVA